MATSHGREIDALLSEYLHSPEMRDKVSEAASAADASVKAELANYTSTGKLLEESEVEVTEFSAGYGMTISSLYRSFFVANKKGIRLKRTGFKRGAGQRRKNFDSNGILKVARPSVIGEGIKTINDFWLTGEDE